MDSNFFDLALNFEINEFEDVIKYYTAIEFGIYIIILRYMKDIKNLNCM